LAKEGFMSRLLRLIVPVLGCTLISSAIVIACGAHREAPNAAPRPDTLAPNGMPTGLRPISSVGEAHSDVSSVLASPLAQPASAVATTGGNGAAATLPVAAQPGAPQPGAPSPGTPAPSAPPPGPSSPTQPGQPGAPAPGTPTQPGPSAPAPGPGPTAPPAAPSPPGPGPGTSSGPGDAGVSDGSLPMPPVPDAGLPRDAGPTPILRKN
jgi:hypothetical protein